MKYILYIYVLYDLFMGTTSPKTLHCSKEDLSPLGFLAGVRAPTDGVPQGNEGNLQELLGFETAFLWARDYPRSQMYGGFKPSHIIT